MSTNHAAGASAAGLPAHDVTDLGLAAEGVRRIEWAEREMPVLRLIRERFEREKPLEGYRVSACLHVTTETANLMRTLKAGGAELVKVLRSPDVVAGLEKLGAAAVGNSPEEFRKKFTSELAKWKKVVEDNKIQSTEN